LVPSASSRPENHHKKYRVRGRNGSSCDAESDGDYADMCEPYLAVRKRTVACWAVPLTACSGNSSRKRALLLHRTVGKRSRISIVLRKTRFDDGIEGEGAKMMEDGGWSHCATAIRNALALGRKTESSSEDKNTKHDTREIQEADECYDAVIP
jgi:hypothetical protein